MASAGVSPGTGPNRGIRSQAALAAPKSSSRLGFCAQGFWPESTFVDAPSASAPAASAPAASVRVFFQGGVGGDFGIGTVGVAGLGGQAGVGGGGCTAPRTPTRFAQIASNEDAFASSGGVRTCAAAIGCDIGCDQEAQLAASDSSNAL